MRPGEHGPTRPRRSCIPTRLRGRRDRSGALPGGRPGAAVSGSAGAVWLYAGPPRAGRAASGSGAADARAARSRPPGLSAARAPSRGARGSPRSGLSDATIAAAGLYTPAPGDLPRLLSARLVDQVRHVLVFPYDGAAPRQPAGGAMTSSSAASSSRRSATARATRSATTSARARRPVCTSQRPRERRSPIRPSRS